MSRPISAFVWSVSSVMLVVASDGARRKSIEKCIHEMGHLRLVHCHR